jgi:aldehyde:ferredoxin oxidoreductase
MYGGPVSPDPGGYEGKGRMVAVSEKMLVMPDVLGICKFLTRGFMSPEGMLGYQEYADLVNAVTGFGVTPSEMEECGERVANLERMFNLREGLRREHDTLPKRYFEEETRGGRLSGQKVDREGFEQMLDEYYELCGWDREGIPRAETRSRLSLDREPSHVL